MLRTRIVTLLCLSTLALAGCSGTTDDTPGPGTPDVASAPGDTATNAGGPSAAELCDYLRAELPKLKAVGGDIGAMAQLTVGLTNFFAANGKPADGSQMDELTTAECPDVRTEVLSTIGKNAFAEL